MVKMNRCEAEIDAIRLMLYDEIKDLSVEEQINRSRNNAKELSLKFGFTIVPTTNINKTP